MFLNTFQHIPSQILLIFYSSIHSTTPAPFTILDRHARTTLRRHGGDLTECSGQWKSKNTSPIIPYPSPLELAKFMKIPN